MDLKYPIPTREIHIDWRKFTAAWIKAVTVHKQDYEKGAMIRLPQYGGPFSIQLYKTRAYL
jgi:hypothetical protein